jgi:hypothetical protein
MMSDGTLTIEHGEVRLNNKIVPGILKSMNVRNSVRMDKAKQDPMSGKIKTSFGWEDADISIEMQLVSDDHLQPAPQGDTAAGLNCYEKLAELNAIFKDKNSAKRPKVYEVANVHLQARGIDKVVFARLYSEETNENDVIPATLLFTEDQPRDNPPESNVAASDKPMGEAPATQATEPEPDSTIMRDPFSAGFAAGSG